MTAILTATLADMLAPLYSGRLLDIVARGDAMEAIAWNAALAAFSTLVALGLVARLTVRRMHADRLGDGSEIEWLQVGNAVFQERVLLTDYFSRYFEDRVGALIEATDQVRLYRLPPPTTPPIALPQRRY